MGARRRDVRPLRQHEPPVIDMSCVTVDCADPALVARFWSAALCWTEPVIADDNSGAVCSPPLYYTLSGSPTLYFCLFSPESGIVSPEELQVPGASLADTHGMFLSGNDLYTVSTTTGALSVRPWNNGALGTATIVSGPALDGIDWRGSALFVGS